MVYLFWWHKPLDIQQPSTISEPSLYGVLAYMYMTSDNLTIPYRRIRRGLCEADLISADTSTMISVQKSLKLLHQEAEDSARTSFLGGLRRYQSMLLPLHSPPSKKDHGVAGKMELGEAKTLPITLAKGAQLQATGLRNIGDLIWLQPEDIRRWTLAADLLKCSKECRQQTVVDHAGDLPPLDLDPSRLDWSLLVAFNISSVLYVYFRVEPHLGIPCSQIPLVRLQWPPGYSPHTAKKRAAPVFSWT